MTVTKRVSNKGPTDMLRSAPQSQPVINEYIKGWPAIRKKASGMEDKTEETEKSTWRKRIYVREENLLKTCY